MRNREKARKKKESKKKGNPPHPKGKKKEINKERRKREKEKKIKKEKDHLQQKKIFMLNTKNACVRVCAHIHTRQAHRHAHGHTCTRTSHDGRRRPQQREIPPEMPFVLLLTVLLPFRGTLYHPEGKMRPERLILRQFFSSPQPRSCSGFWHSIAA